MDFQSAFSFASKRRPIIFPNMGFQRQLQEFEKLLHLHRSYSSPSRYIKQNQQLNGGNSSDSILKSLIEPARKFDSQIERQVQKTLAQRGSSNGNNPPMGNTFYHQSSANPTASTADDLRDDFARVTYFDRSAAFGFAHDDKLGRLAELNKKQLDQALQNID